MSYNGSGTFQINTSGQPVVAGTVISSTAFNALTADLAPGLSTAITKDGQTTTTARIPFAAGINSSLTTDSTNSTSGSIITAGGVGIAKALYVGTTANVAGAVTLQSTLGVTGVATFSAAPIYSSLTASSAVATDASKALVSVTNTGTGNNVLATSPTITTPTLSGDTIAGTINGLTVGKGAGAVATNTAVGASAIAATATATRSTAIGFEALKALTSGDPNTAVGAYALNKNTTGAANVGVGAYALEDNTTGSSNSALGNEALANNTTGSSCVAVGASALLSNTTASNNTAVGYRAGYTQTTATGNTIVGKDAGYGLTTGSYNTFVGSINSAGGGCGELVTTGAKNTIIGGFNGNQNSLDIRTSSNYIVLSDGDGNPRGIFDNSGNFLVGTTTTAALPTSTADIVAGGFALNISRRTTGTSGNTYWSPSDGYFYRSTSSLRYKINVQDYSRGLTDIAKLRPVTFNSKPKDGEENPDTNTYAGFIAEEVHDAGLTEYVQYANDGIPESLSYANMVALLTKAIQEQQALITALTARITALEST